MYCVSPSPSYLIVIVPHILCIVYILPLPPFFVIVYLLLCLNCDLLKLKSIPQGCESSRVRIIIDSSTHKKIHWVHPDFFYFVLQPNTRGATTATAAITDSATVKVSSTVAATTSTLQSAVHLAHQSGRSTGVAHADGWKSRPSMPQIRV